MAIAQYGGGVEELTGSIAGNTFCRNRSGTIVRSRRVPTQPLSASQLYTCAQTAALQVAWRLLTSIEQDSWNDFAALHDRINPFGKTTHLSGHQWFLSCNSNLLLVGGELLETAPAYVPPDPVEYVDELQFDSFGITILTLPDAPPANNAWVVYSSPLSFARTGIKKSLLRLTTIKYEDDPEPFDLTAGWISAHNCPWPPSGPFRANMQVWLVAVSILNGLTSLGCFQVRANY